jgi:hypothetical protein
MTSTMLLVFWFVIVAFAVATVVYYVVSSELRRQVAKHVVDPSQLRIYELRRRTGRVLDYMGAFAVLLILAMASAHWVSVYVDSNRALHQSQKLAREFQDEQYTEARVTPRLLFSAFNENSIAGKHALVGSAFVLDAKLQDAGMKTNQCDPKLHEAVKQTQLHIVSVGITSSTEPAIDDNNPCFVKWSWIVVPQHDGMLVLLASGTLRLPGAAQIMHIEKPIRIVVDPDLQATRMDAASISGIAVALLSLAGLIFTTFMNRLSRAAAQKPNDANL